MCTDGLFYILDKTTSIRCGMNRTIFVAPCVINGFLLKMKKTVFAFVNLYVIMN